MSITRRSHIDRGRNLRGRAVAAPRSEKDRAGNQAAQSFDGSPESAQLRAMQLMADNSPRSAKFASLQAMADRSPQAVAQRKLMEGAPGALIQRQGDEEDLQMKQAPGLIQRQGDEEELQMKAASGTIQRQGEEDELQMKAAPGTIQRQGDEDELQMKAVPGLIQLQGDEEDLQMKAAPGLIQRQGDEEDLQMKAAPGLIQRQSDEEDLQMKSGPVRKAPNNTGMPDNIKSGVENLSGISMDDVKVHYNSPKPASVQALAYTQGSDIHVGPGQEKHLAHEAWHVAQQKQGRVRPTVRIAGAQVNDDKGLEHEADVMGHKAAHSFHEETGLLEGESSRVVQPKVVQRTKQDILQANIYWKQFTSNVQTTDVDFIESLIEVGGFYSNAPNDLEPHPDANIEAASRGLHHDAAEIATHAGGYLYQQQFAKSLIQSKSFLRVMGGSSNANDPDIIASNLPLGQAGPDMPMAVEAKRTVGSYYAPLIDAIRQLCGRQGFPLGTVTIMLANDQRATAVANHWKRVHNNVTDYLLENREAILRSQYQTINVEMEDIHGNQVFWDTFNRGYFEY